MLVYYIELINGPKLKSWTQTSFTDEIGRCAAHYLCWVTVRVRNPKEQTNSNHLYQMTVKWYWWERKAILDIFKKVLLPSWQSHRHIRQHISRQPNTASCGNSLTWSNSPPEKATARSASSSQISDDTASVTREKTRAIFLFVDRGLQKKPLVQRSFDLSVAAGLGQRNS